MASNTAEQTMTRKKRDRSPSYPAIGLEEAIRRARLVWQHEKRNLAPLDAILSDWKQKPGSSTGMVTLAALIKFGLLADQGSGVNRKAKLTDLALGILLDERDESTERQALIRQAALLPTIHADLWKTYGPILPSDATLRLYLTKDKTFNPSAVDDFIRQFRQTVAFAKLTESDKLTENGDKDEEELAPLSHQNPPTATIFASMVESRKMIPVPGPHERVLEFPIPLPDTDQLAGLQVPMRMSEEAWGQMLAIINAFKPSIVQGPRKSEPGADPKLTSELDPA